MFPVSFDENTADIWRGYIMQYFAWKMKGVIAYYNSEINNFCDFKNRSNILKEKKNYFGLNKLLSVLNSYKNNDKNVHPLKFYNNFLNMLVTHKIIEKKDFSVYLAFSEDLSEIL